MKYQAQGTGKKVEKKDYSKEIIFDLADLPAGGHMFQTVTIAPHVKQRTHYHHKQTEIFYILAGECLIFINDQEYLAQKGDAFVCSPRDTHSLWNKSDEPFILAVFKINKPEDDDIVWKDK